MGKINIHRAFDRIPELWSPHIAAVANGQEVRLAKIHGSFEWHRHEGVDEVFFVIKGEFTMRLRDEDVHLGVGDLIVVSAGTEHMPHADEECWIMMFEKAGTLNTGEVVTERTRQNLPVL